MVIISLVFWLAIMLALTLSDYSTRQHEGATNVTAHAEPIRLPFHIWYEV